MLRKKRISAYQGCPRYGSSSFGRGSLLIRWALPGSIYMPIYRMPLLRPAVPAQIRVRPHRVQHQIHLQAQRRRTDDREPRPAIFYADLHFCNHSTGAVPDVHADKWDHPPALHASAHCHVRGHRGSMGSAVHFPAVFFTAHIFLRYPAVTHRDN